MFPPFTFGDKGKENRALGHPEETALQDPNRQSLFSQERKMRSQYSSTIVSEFQLDPESP